MIDIEDRVKRINVLHRILESMLVELKECDLLREETKAESE